MKKLIAGNWKMNGDLGSSIYLAKNIVGGIENKPDLLKSCDFVICPPYPFLTPVREVLSPSVALGAQDCAPEEEGAYTGDISASMLSGLGCSYVILGHSERRTHHGERDETVKRKALMARQAGLVSIICVGETLAQRQAGEAQKIVKEQLAASVPDGANGQNTVIAYEPVWAIGTGQSATAKDILDMHAFIRGQLGDKTIQILYGGSLKPSNASEILAVEHVDGGLIGGASLNAEDFLGIAAAANPA